MTIHSLLVKKSNNFIQNINQRKTGIYLPKNININYTNTESQYIAYVTCRNTKWTLVYNNDYIALIFDKLFLEVISHEIAHIATMHMYNSLGHDWLWKEICLKLGGNGKQFFEI